MTKAPDTPQLPSFPTDFSLYSIPGIREIQTKLNQLTSYIPPPPAQEPFTPRKILLVHAHPDPNNSFSAAIADQVEKSAHQAGHQIEIISLYPRRRRGLFGGTTPLYEPQLSLEQWRTRDETGSNPDLRNLPPDVRRHVKLLQWCDTLVFVYPTWWMNLPATLKGFLDRTLVHDLTYRVGDNGALEPLCTKLQHVVGISTYGAPYSFVTLAGDGGRGTIANAIRPVIAPAAKVTWLGLYDMDNTTPDSRKEFLLHVDALVQSNNL